MSGCGCDMLDGAIGLTKAGLQLVGLNVDRAGVDIVAARRDQCRVCPQARRDERFKSRPLTSASTCRLCGCFIKAKTMLASQRCPDDPPKWDAVPPDEPVDPGRQA